MNVQELLGSKTAIIKKMSDLVDLAEKQERDLTPDELVSYNTLLSDVKELDSRLKRAIELKDVTVEQIFQEARTIGEDHSAPDSLEFRTSKGEVIKGYKRGQQISTQRAGIGRFIRSIYEGENASMSAEEKRALAAGSGSGSYTVPTAVSKNVIDRLRENLVFDQAGAVTIPLVGPTDLVSITADPSSEWHVENDTLTDSDPTFAPVSLSPKWITTLVKISRELVATSVNLESALEMALVNGIKNTLEAGILSGTGANGQIQGMDLWSNILKFGLATDGATLTNFEDILYAQYLLENANANPTAAILSPRTSRDINNTTDTTGQPLNRPTSLVNLPFLVTKNVRENYEQGSSGAITSKMYIGDFSKMYIGILQNIRIDVLKETYAQNFQYGFLASFAVDVKPLMQTAFCRVDGIKPNSFSSYV